MKNILYEIKWGIELPPDVQLKRLRRVMDRELTPRQRQTLDAYYFEGMRLSQIARRQGIHRSTVARTLRRAEDKLRRFLTY